MRGLLIVEDNRSRPWCKMMDYIITRCGSVDAAGRYIGIPPSECSSYRTGKRYPWPSHRARIQAAFERLMRGEND